MDNQIIALSGSNSSNSINEQLLHAATKELPSESINFVNLKELKVPMYSKDLEDEQGFPESIKELFQQFTQADGFIIASPEHNGLIPAFFKNILDWLTRIDQNIFMDKPVLLLSTSPGQGGGKNNLSILSETMPFWGAEIIGTYSLGNFDEVFDTDSRSITDDRKAQNFSKTIEKFSRHIFPLQAA